MTSLLRNTWWYTFQLSSGILFNYYLQYIGSNHWIDKNYVFYNGKKIENSDASTFEALDGSYFRDKNNIYYNHEKIDVDIPSFKLVGKSYAVDKNHVYVNGTIDKRYDVKTFNIKETYY